MSDSRGLKAVGLSRNLLRGDAPIGADNVTFVELFFDLVFVFAITQLSVLLETNPNLVGLLETVILCLAVWWVWVYTTWVTNWLDPETRPVMWLLLAFMVCGLVLSESIPEAFASKGFVFVGAYLAYFVVRTVFVTIATAKHRPAVAIGQSRILVWVAAASPFWIAGAFVALPWRILLWGIAIIIDYVGPATRFWIPGVRQTSWEAWQIRGAHFAQRSALFILIALGESILVTGAALTGESFTPERVASFAAAFATSVTLFLLYFARGEDRGMKYIVGSATTGPVARNSYTYLHVVLVLGIVLTTHANNVVLGQPGSEATVANYGFRTLGPVLFLVGNMVFAHSVGSPWLLSHILGILALTVLFIAGATGLISLTVLGLAWTATALLALVVVLEGTMRFRRPRRKPKNEASSH